MLIDKISIGPNPPWDIHVIVEVPMGREPVKYEMDKESGAIFVDRIMHTSMRYPCNYGFVPHTMSDDGDPIDVMVAGSDAFISGCVARCRPIGVLKMEDEGGIDEKILAVPVDALHPYYSDVKEYSDLPSIVLEQIAHFFAHYKDLEAGKWAKLSGWGGSEEAARYITESIERAKSSKAA